MSQMLGRPWEGIQFLKLKMMDFTLKMMDFVFKMMNFVFKMMNLIGPEELYTPISDFETYMPRHMVKGTRNDGLI